MEKRLVFKAIIAIAFLLAVAGAEAKTIGWAIAPDYDKLSRHHSDIFLCERNGKWGLEKIGNGEILPTRYEITNFINGYALAVAKGGDNRYRLQCIVSENGNVVTMADEYYISRGAPYFSEGKLVVVDSNGKYGFINGLGHVVVKCQFDDALPFKQGWAPIKQGNFYKYIKEGYDKDPSLCTMRVDFHDGDITRVGCFSDGLAPVAYGKDYALIDLGGKKVKKLNEAEFKKMRSDNNAPAKAIDDFQEVQEYQVISQNGFYGLKQGIDTVAIPQFDSIGKQYADGFVIVSKDGKTGLLRFEEGNYTLGLQSVTGFISELDVDRNGNAEEVVLAISAPEEAGGLKLMVDAGDGRMIQTDQQPNGQSSVLRIVPIVNDGAEECRVSAKLVSDGLIVAEVSKLFSLIYPVILDVTPPSAVSMTADENDNVTIYSVITNSSRKPVTLTVTLSAKHTVSDTYDIPPGDSVRISVSEKITELQTVNVTVSLSTGESASSNLQLEPYN